MPEPLPNLTDYEETYRSFEWKIPERFNFAYDVVDRLAEDRGRLALYWVGEKGQERRYTFWDFRVRSNKCASVLNDLGIGKGDVVLVMLPRIPEWQVVMLGLMKLGAIPAPGTTMLTAKDIEYRANLAEAKAVITDQETAEKVDRIKDACPSLRHVVLVGGERNGWIDLDHAMKAPSGQPADGAEAKSRDPALLYFTSGTAGGPKMVLHNHSYALAHRLTGEYWLDLKPTDLHWNLSDTGWAKAAYSTLFGPWNMGTAVFMYQGAFDPKETLDLLQNYEITVFCAPPTVYRMLVKEDLKGYQFRLRHAVGAGEPLNPEVIAVWQDATGIPILDGYGQTETIILICNYPCIETKPGSMGKPMPGHEIAIVDSNGNELPTGEEGEIALKGHPPSLFQGYRGNAELTARTRRGEWYVTGDRAYKDEDGYFWFVGRADDVIISSGYRIGPFEVESALVEHPAVVEAAVVASPDETRGQVVKAFVILHEGFAPSDRLVEELQAHVRNVTAPYKYPREIEFVDVLPKTISGKIRRVELRRREMERKTT